MARAWEPFVVRQGDYLDRIAYERGFDAKTAWDDPRNADLRARREDPALLCPGDILMVPPRGQGQREVALGGTNRYEANVPSVRVSLRLRRGSEPFAGSRWAVRGPGISHEGTVGPEGEVDIDVPMTAREVVLALPERRVEWTIQIGGLDPHDEPSGVRGRLENLGYLPREAAGDTAALRAGIEDFQRVRGLEVTGAADEATTAALRDAHAR